MKGQPPIMVYLRCLVHAVPQLATALVFCLLSVVTGNAQQTNGVAGLPNATMKI